MKQFSEFLKLEVDLGELSGIVGRALGRECRLHPLSVKCTYPVFRGELADGSQAFVKLGLEDEWRRTLGVVRELGNSPFFAKFLVETPRTYKGYAVFVTEWKNTQTIFPEDMSETQADHFVRGCERFSKILQAATDFIPLDKSGIAPERLYAIVSGYVARHRLSGRLLSELMTLPVRQRTYDRSRLVVVHGDFHAKNFGFADDELAVVYDFDKLTQGPACGDFINALVERFSCLGMDGASRSRLVAVSRLMISRAPWPREEMIAAVNVARLRFAAHRIEKHPNSAWVALDILRRDRKIREILACGLEE